MKRILFFIVLSTIVSCKQKPTIILSENKALNNKNTTIGPAKVTLHNSNNKFQLMVNNEPFYIKGAGLEFGNVSALASHNANSFRTWRTDNGRKTALEVLDEAHENGLMVNMGIDVGRERHGFDYDNEELVKEQLQRIKKEVTEIKDHPALLMWGIGNELNLHYTNPKVWDAVNDISKMIHEIDGNHPTSTSLAGITQKEIDLIKTRCNDIDILSIQMYGDLPDLPKLIKKHDWKGPYMVGEWGATGHWEVPKTKWEAPIEDNSTVKASNYMKRFQGGIAADKKQCIGSFVFLWGNKQERTPTWYGIFLADGQETESVDVMHYIWNGQWPENKTPSVVSFQLDGKTAYDNIYLQPEKQYTAQITIVDPEKDTITYVWEIMPESTDLKYGGDHEEKPPTIKGLFVEERENSLVFNAPNKSGAYRLFVYATDGNNHSATANIPFYVN